MTWKAVRARSGLIRGINTEDGSVVVRWHGLGSPSSEEGQKRALLISAAPDLLKALNCVPTDADYWSHDEFVSALGHWWSEMALPAINKAEGRS